MCHKMFEIVKKFKIEQKIFFLEFFTTDFLPLNWHLGNQINFMGNPVFILRNSNVQKYFSVKAYFHAYPAYQIIKLGNDFDFKDLIQLPKIRT